MCGLAGWVRLDGKPLTNEVDGPVLKAMGAAIAHRGPDDSQTMIWQNVGFIFQRLSIVDLAGGRQPFETPDGRICAMVNGEIYNHADIRRGFVDRYHLRSDSDCEVIPYQYLDRGLDLLDGVNGMFAMALLDREQRRLLLARDRVGIKPLYYCLADKGRLLLFSSELKGLFAHPAVPREFDWAAALERNFGASVQPSELGSFFKGIEKLPAGSILDLNIDDGRYSVDRYWSLPGRDPAAPIRSAEHYIDRYGELLADSVRLRLMADVRYGVFLSGGIDSAAIAAFAASHKSCPTFSVLDKATLAAGDAEASHAVARHLDLPNHQVLFDAEDIRYVPDDWRHILWACEYHITNPEQLYKYWLHAFARERYADLKVILLGQGSDEFNGGYITKFVQGAPDWGPDHWDQLGGGLRRHENLMRATKRGLTLDWGDLIQNGVLDLTNLEGFLNDGGAVLDHYHGFYRQNLDYHLWHEDRTASAHSIENRVPFLDHRLLEFISSVPEPMHAELFTNKAILRRSVAHLLPPHSTDREKGYFYIGPGEQHTNALVLDILDQNGGELVEQAIEGSRASGGVLVPDAIRTVVREVAQDPLHRGLQRLLQLLNMGLLSDMVSNSSRIPVRSDRLPVYEIDGERWQRWVSEERSRMETTLLPEPHDEMVLALGRGVSLVEVKNGGQGNLARGTLCVAVDGQIRQSMTSPTWVRFVQALDGRRSIAQICTDEGLNRIRIRKMIPKALEEGMLEVAASAGGADAAAPATDGQAQAKEKPRWGGFSGGWKH